MPFSVDSGTEPFSTAASQLAAEVLGTEDLVDRGGVVLVGGAGHLQVQAGPRGLDRAVQRAPVGHDEAVELPGVAQDVGQLSAFSQA